MLKEIIIEPSAICEMGTDLFFYQKRYMMLIKLNMLKMCFEVVYEFDGKEELEVSDILSNENDIYLIPKCGAYIYVYEIQERQIQKINPGSLDIGQELFSGAYVQDGKLYCVPLKQKKIIVISCAEKRVINEINIDIKQNFNCCSTLAPSVFYDSCILINLREKRRIIVCDVRNESIIEKELIKVEKGIYSSMGVFNRCIFLYDKIKKRIDAYELPDFRYRESYKLDDNMTYRVLETKQGILVDSLFSEDIGLYDESFNLLQSCEQVVKQSRYGYAEGGLMVGLVSHEKKYYYNAATNCLYDVNALDMPIIEFKMCINKKCRNKEFEKKKIFQEEKTYDLRQFICELEDQL